MATHERMISLVRPALFHGMLTCPTCLRKKERNIEINIISQAAGDDGISLWACSSRHCAYSFRGVFRSIPCPTGCHGSLKAFFAATEFELDASKLIDVSRGCGAPRCSLAEALDTDVARVWPTAVAPNGRVTVSKCRSGCREVAIDQVLPGLSRQWECKTWACHGDADDDNNTGGGGGGSIQLEGQLPPWESRRISNEYCSRQITAAELAPEPNAAQRRLVKALNIQAGMFAEYLANRQRAHAGEQNNEDNDDDEDDDEGWDSDDEIVIIPPVRSKRASFIARASPEKSCLKPDIVHNDRPRTLRRSESFDTSLPGTETTNTPTKASMTPPTIEELRQPLLKTATARVMSVDRELETEPQFVADAMEVEENGGPVGVAPEKTKKRVRFIEESGRED